MLAKSQELHEGQLVCAPAETRPISLSNTDGKILASTTRANLAPVIAAGVAMQQRGRLMGRRLEHNIVRLECAALRWALTAPLLAGMVTFDFNQ